MLPVMSRSDAHVGFPYPFLHARSGAQVKLHAQKIGRDEIKCYLFI